MPINRTSTSTTYDLTTPIILTASEVYLSNPSDTRSIVVEQVTVTETIDGEGTQVSHQILITGYALTADGERTGRVYGTPVTNPGQRTDLLAHIAQEN